MYFFKFHKLFLLVGIISILYFIVLKLSLWSMAFAEFWLVLGCTLIVVFLLNYYSIDLLSYLPPLLKKIINFSMVMGIFLFLALEVLIVYNGCVKDDYKPDYILVLGAGLNGDKLSASLRLRLESSIKLHKKYPNIKIVVSGGQGPGENITEALAMKKFLLSNEVPDNLIIMEDKSTTTYENFLFTKEILDRDHKISNPINIAVVTNNFHMFRAKYIGEKVGFKIYRYPASSKLISAPNFYVREAFASVKTIMLKR
ncbi:YdcF family protein [Clostridium tunisiense]|uniref:YdcF family protein n=1 Tax=Clostridium tunisiense TaxID=219748 RepID=UPI00031613EF|nr:YdcF family protein [Clostridium tunisiense]